MMVKNAHVILVCEIREVLFNNSMAEVPGRPEQTSNGWPALRILCR